MALTNAQLKLITSGVPYVPAFPVAVATAIPTISGAAVEGGTLTLSHATWSNNPYEYEYKWQIATDAPNYVAWVDISAAQAITYLIAGGSADGKIRGGERALTLGGWSAWSYSLPTGIVVVSAPPGAAPTIDTAAYFTAVGGGSATPAYINDVREIQAPTVSGETGWWIYLVRDGVVVDIDPIAYDGDTFPLQYTINAEDYGTTLELLTRASNASSGGTTEATSADIGPIAWPTGGGGLLDLGSAQATEDFIISTGFANHWTPQGTATDTITASSFQDLKNKWDNQVRTAATDKRWEITLDWDGLDTIGADTNAVTFLGPSGTANWKQDGGWVKWVAAPGKRPTIGNRIDARNWCGVAGYGIDFTGRYTQQNGGFGCIQFSTGGGYTLEPCVYFYDCRIGRKAFSGAELETSYIRGFYSATTIEQLSLEKCAIAGTYAAINCPARRTKLYNCDLSATLEDVLKSYVHSKTNYYAYWWVENVTIRAQSRSQSTAAYHTDTFQSGHASDQHTGNRVLFKNVVVHMDHKYASSAGEGDTQGFLNNFHTYLDNLFCVRYSIFLHTSPHGIDCTSPNATMVSYVERTTFGRAGLTPSQFDGTNTNKDFNMGIYTAVVAPSTGGIAFKIINCLYSFAGTASFVEYTGNVLMNYQASATGVTPEDVFNGADFTRGGAAANFQTNKFAYDLDQSSQSNFVTAINDNFTPQGGYAAKGCPALNPALFTAPLVA